MNSPSLAYKGPAALEPVVASCLAEIRDRLSLSRGLTFSVGYREFPQLPPHFDPYFILSNGVSGRVEHDTYTDQLLRAYAQEQRKPKPNTFALEDVSQRLHRHCGENTIRTINDGIRDAFDLYSVEVKDTAWFDAHHLEMTAVRNAGGLAVIERVLNLCVGHNYLSPTQEVFVPAYIVLCLIGDREEYRTILGVSPGDHSGSHTLLTNLISHGVVHHELYGTTPLCELASATQRSLTLFGNLLKQIAAGDVDRTHVKTSPLYNEYHDAAQRAKYLFDETCVLLNIDAVEEAAAHVIAGPYHKAVCDAEVFEAAQQHLRLLQTRKNLSHQALLDLTKGVLEEAYAEKRNALDILRNRAVPGL